MEHESPKNEISTNAPTLESPWVTYLTGRKVSANGFLRDMAKGVVIVQDEATGKKKKRTTNKTIKPDEGATVQFAEALTDKPDQGVKRLLDLLQASASADDHIRRIVTDLTEAGIKAMGIIEQPESLEPASFSHAVSSWLNGLGGKAVKRANLDTLLVLVHFGWYRRLLDHDTAWRFVASGVSKATRTRKATARSGEFAPTLLDVLLAIPTPEAVLPHLLTYFDLSKEAKDGLDAQIQSLEGRIDNLATERNFLNTTAAELRDEIAALKEQQTVTETTIAQLEKQSIDIRASYQHKIDDLRGRIRGTHEGQLTRWLQTSLDAVRASPPRTEVVEERLEEALDLIEREMQWLQPSV